MAPELAPRVLEDVARRILEEAAFLFSDDATDSLCFEGPVIEALLEFLGPAQGTLHLRLAENLACEAAANLLGTEPDDPEAQAGASLAVGELLNMIGGHLMIAWLGATAQTSLGTPTLRLHDTWTVAMTGPRCARFMAGEGALVELEARIR
jgi:hypothetical protein